MKSPNRFGLTPLAVIALAAACGEGKEPEEPADQQVSDEDSDSPRVTLGDDGDDAGDDAEDADDESDLPEIPRTPPCDPEVVCVDISSRGNEVMEVDAVVAINSRCAGRVVSLLAATPVNQIEDTSEGAGVRSEDEDYYTFPERDTAVRQISFDCDKGAKRCATSEVMELPTNNAIGARVALETNPPHVIQACENFRDQIRRGMENPVVDVHQCNACLRDNNACNDFDPDPDTNQLMKNECICYRHPDIEWDALTGYRPQAPNPDRNSCRAGEMSAVQRMVRDILAKVEQDKENRNTSRRFVARAA